MPYCHAAAIKCRDVPRVEGAVADTSRGHVGTIVTYTCEGGLRFPDGTESAQTQCTGRGTWYPELDACKGALHMCITQRVHLIIRCVYSSVFSGAALTPDCLVGVFLVRCSPVPYFHLTVRCVFSAVFTSALLPPNCSVCL